MANTAHKDPELITEHFDEPDILQKKAKELVKLIRSSKHCIFFTGAGISTACGIPDFRGPEGAWTLAAQGRTRTAPTTSSLKAIPSLSHMSIVELQAQGLCKYLVSQNTDGLHRKSGIDTQKLSELHGNSNLERCTKCGKEFLRDYRVRSASKVHDHKTGNACTACRGPLIDTIINFGESLPRVPLERGFDNADKADLCIVLGSSCTVTPACDIPKQIGKKKGGKLVICNLQVTPLDKHASLRIYARCDDLMKLVMKGLGLEIPPFILRRKLLINYNYSNTTSSSTSTKKNSSSVPNFDIHPLDMDGTPATYLQLIDVAVKLESGKKIKRQLKKNIHNEFKVEIPEANSLEDVAGVKFDLHFMGNYNEPVHSIDFDLKLGSTEYTMLYNPLNGVWDVQTTPSEESDKMQS